MRRWLLFSLLALITFPGVASAEDPAIDRLINKLPPPEKLVKPSIQQRLQRQQSDPALKDPLVKQTIFALAHGNISAALNSARTLAAKHPTSAAAQEVHALVAFLVRQYPEAEAALHRTLAIQPKRANAHLGLVIVELVQHRPAAALPHARALTELEPNYVDGWILLSGCEEAVGQKEQSAAAARQAAKLAPSSLSTWVQLARAENKLGHTHQALEALSKASEIAPDNAAVQATVGFGYININQSAQAVRPLARAAQLAPRDYLVQSQLGFALYVAGQTDAAIDHLRRGASLRPSYGPVWEHLGLAYAKTGRHREAQDAFQRAARLMPKNAVVRTHLAQEHAALGQGVRR